MRIPQLQMRRPDLLGLPDPDPRVRLALVSDAVDIARILTLAFGEDWDEARLMAELFDHPRVPLTFVAVVDGMVAAVASYQLHGGFPESGWVHWVGADPAFSGRGLGFAVSLSVLHAALADGKVDCGLTTDDERLAAIRTYLKLGFEPDPCDESHPERWGVVMGSLGVGR